MENEIMETVENNNGKLALGGALIGLAGAGLGVLGKVIFDKVKIKMAEKAADNAEPESKPETTK